MLKLQQQADAPHYLLDDMIEDVLDRLSFLRHDVRRALIIGDTTGALHEHLRQSGAEVITADPATGLNDEEPYPFADFDFVACLGTLDTTNDLPGALIHLRHALAVGGLMIASFLGAGSLPKLRSAMLAGDGDRPAARIHPQIDVRAGGQLLQRAGFSDPVIDSRTLDVGFRSLHQLVADLRAQGLSNCLARSGPSLNRSMLNCVETDFAAATEDGRTVERFEIITLSGWRK